MAAAMSKMQEGFIRIGDVIFPLLGMPTHGEMQMQRRVDRHLARLARGKQRRRRQR
jgi:hypothetical protein